MKEPKKLNKAISDSIASVLSEGIDVNVKIPTETLLKLGFFTLVISIIIGAVSYGTHFFKTR